MNQLLWLEYDIVKLVEYHEVKYTYEFTNLDKTVFKTHLDFLKEISKSLNELIIETHNHRDLAVVKIKTLINDLTKKIVEEA